ncbi:NAC domain-containing protein 35 [Capsicum chacoense]|uniref:NAC domain-containing protein 94 n=1 Tax=Capsicum annuum TaxID=4072 RepID=A0A1U8DV76_CAPAN|nr:NAC domain-containing protein 35 [Capsicum annuum]PHT62199.1 putative NAC domain-containing protein 94 [Capsicum annuum]
MAIVPFTTTMSQSQQQQDHDNINNNTIKGDDDDDHEHDMVMPGFRFHPTEEELVEFYLRRKVEGKRFNVELITFLDLYRYDPWELPALAAIGEKEWYFYVPRDRKYRNGDRPNRVTTSGYWKATGADRMIRTENSRSIGLKKTLVFYSGKAPKGIRSSWIMNEYRLPQHETERLQKAEISLCRVYKRAGVEDHPSLPRSLLTTRASSSSSSRGTTSIKKQQQDSSLVSPLFVGQSSQQQQQMDEKLSTETSASSTSTDHHHHHQHHHHVATSLGLNSLSNSYTNIALDPNIGGAVTSSLITTSSTLTPFTSLVSTTHNADDLHRLINLEQAVAFHNNQHHFHNPINHPSVVAAQQFPPLLLQQPHLAPQQPQSLLLQGSLQSSAAAAFSDRLWEWNSINQADNANCKDPYQPNDPFK